MKYKEKKVPVNGSVILLLAIVSGIILQAGYTRDGSWYWGLLITLPLLLIAIIDTRPSKHTDMF